MVTILSVVCGPFQSWFPPASVCISVLRALPRPPHPQLGKLCCPRCWTSCAKERSISQWPSGVGVQVSQLPIPSAGMILSLLLCMVPQTLPMESKLQVPSEGVGLTADPLELPSPPCSPSPGPSECLPHCLREPFSLVPLSGICFWENLY